MSLRLHTRTLLTLYLFQLRTRWSCHLNVLSLLSSSGLKKQPRPQPRAGEPTFRQAGDCISKMKMLGPERGGDWRKVTQPGLDPSVPAPYSVMLCAAQVASPLISSASNMKTICTFSLKLPNPSRFSALENPFGHR